MPASDPAERRAIATIGAHSKWKNCDDRAGATAAARAAFDRKFEDEVDPDRVLPPEERTKRAANARALFYARFSRQGIKARQRKAGG